ncbi:MAG: HAD hydrolase family protein [Bacteroidia bacterium]|nr:HAD hydrolase family protein [Bacteroidia bacterium]
MSNFKEDLLNIRAFAFDVDGVFSGNILLSSSGEQLRPMNMKDGYAVQLAVKKGYPVAIISGGACESIRKRFSGLGVKDIYIGSSDKMKDFEDFLGKNNLDFESILYMGDDLPDYFVMKKAGIATCPSDAAQEIKSISKYVSSIRGGDGCVRDVIEQVLRAQGKWMDTDAFKW